VRVAICMEQCLAPVPGGTGRYTRELAAALVRTAPAGSSVTGWTANHRDVEPARVPGVAGPRQFTLPRRALVATWEWGLGPTPRDADLVHAPTLLVPPRRTRPLVVTVHDTVPWTHPETLTPRGVSWHRRMGEYVARNADLVVVPTRAVADELVGLLPALAGDRVLVVGHGVSDALLVPPEDADERARRLDLPGDGYVLSVATLEPRKGLDVLLAALADPAAPPLPLLVVGQPGWGGVEPGAEAARHGLPSDRLRVLGRIDDADLAVVLRRATVLAAPSRAEGFGLPVLEAMAVGTPVVSSDAPALVEVGGGATVVVPRDSPRQLAEALRAVAEDGDLRHSLAQAGRRRSERYSWDDAARTLWDAYAKLAVEAA
jgi:glycosyltransferase involved in cell wall biosynthesis